MFTLINFTIFHLLLTSKTKLDVTNNIKSLYTPYRLRKVSLKAWKESIRIMFLIPTRLTDFSQRQAHRMTWIKDIKGAQLVSNDGTKFIFETRFYMGYDKEGVVMNLSRLALIEESYNYDDMVFISTVTENKANNTFKVYSMFKDAINRFSGYDYYFKIGTDLFPFISGIINEDLFLPRTRLKNAVVGHPQPNYFIGSGNKTMKDAYVNKIFNSAVGTEIINNRKDFNHSVCPYGDFYGYSADLIRRITTNSILEQQAISAYIGQEDIFMCYTAYYVGDYNVMKKERHIVPSLKGPFGHSGDLKDPSKYTQCYYSKQGCHWEWEGAGRNPSWELTGLTQPNYTNWFSQGKINPELNVSQWLFDYLWLKIRL